MNLVQVHDSYGHLMYVDPTELNDPRKKPYLHLYTKGGIRLSDLPSNDRRTKGGTLLLRSNICPHPLKSFQTISLLGERSKSCLACQPDLEQYKVT